MPLSPRPLHADEHQPDTGDAPHGFRDWSRHVGDPASGLAPARAPEPDLLGVDPGHPLLKVAAAVFVGYTLGRLVHRGPARARRAAAQRPSGPPPRPVAAAPVRSPREPRSDIRFR
ncbi:hypothetical protein [Lichenibacterium dinghuense]|uniref:hypothetical protein n=1 Tax=Lichenibacterium dinghuense TaxID=2895977 RepID=UPI001F3C0E4B|nr:hypothetical protein [Lichenibacterium sp. 6Y81]